MQIKCCHPAAREAIKARWQGSSWGIKLIAALLVALLLIVRRVGQPVKATSPGHGALGRTDVLRVKRRFQKSSSLPAWGSANRAGTTTAGRTGPGACAPVTGFLLYLPPRPCSSELGVVFLCICKVIFLWSPPRHHLDAAVSDTESQR